MGGLASITSTTNFAHRAACCISACLAAAQHEALLAETDDAASSEMSCLASIMSTEHLDCTPVDPLQAWLQRSMQRLWMPATLPAVR
jgi:hypothetical protein